MNNFKTFILNEGRQFYYSIPTDPKEKMIDFYTLSNINNPSLPLGPKFDIYNAKISPSFYSDKFDDIEYQRKEMLEKLCNHLVKEFKDDVFWSVCAEYVHIFDYNDIQKLDTIFKSNANNEIELRDHGPLVIEGEEEEDEEDNTNTTKSILNMPKKKTSTYLPADLNTPAIQKFYQYTKQNFENRKYSKASYTDKFLKIDDFTKNYKKGAYKTEGKTSSSNAPSQYTFRAAIVDRGLKALKIPERTFIKFAKWLYLNVELSRDFGGIAWARICNAWLVLDDSVDQDLEYKVNAIDGTYHMQHNTGSVFNKLRKYRDEQGDYGWLATILDTKSKSKDYYTDVISQASPDLKDFSKYYLKNLINFAIEDEIAKPTSAKQALAMLSLMTDNFSDMDKINNIAPEPLEDILDYIGTHETSYLYMLNAITNSYRELENIPKPIEEKILGSGYLTYMLLQQTLEVCKKTGTKFKNVTTRKYLRSLSSNSTYAYQLIVKITDNLTKNTKDIPIELIEALEGDPDNALKFALNLLKNTKDVDSIPPSLMKVIATEAYSTQKIIRIIHTYISEEWNGVPEFMWNTLTQDNDYVYSILLLYTKDCTIKEKIENIPDVLIKSLAKNKNFTKGIIDHIVQNRDILVDKNTNIEEYLNKYLPEMWNVVKYLYTKEGSDTPFVDDQGNQRWYKNGKLHRENGPAIINSTGSRYWYKNGNLHREDGPAYEGADGTKYWYLNDHEVSQEEFNEKVKELKKDSTNPVVDKDGTKRWFNEKHLLHREDGPAIVHADGTKHWYKEGDLHRDNGPAVENSNGTKEWWKNGLLHREDGPAYIDGVNKYWYLNGKELTEEQFNQKVKELKKDNTNPVVDAAGTKRWYDNKGELHREDGPAVEWADGAKMWYKHGMRHNEHGPAVIYNNGVKYWYLNNIPLTEQEFDKKIKELKKDNTNPVIDADGTKRWYKDKHKLHREDGPAVEYTDGTKYWYKDGKLHREGGPAIEWSAGNKEWWKDGKLHREDGPAIVCVNGNKQWWIDDIELTEEQFNEKVKELKKDNTNPVIDADGTKRWYNKKGELHREDGPAIEWASGSKKWFINGLLHREDGPAVVYADPAAGEHWYLYGTEFTKEEFIKQVKELKKDSTNPVVDADGAKRWYNEKGDLHREDGPAVVYKNGTKKWFINGLLHREDGPAVEWNDGTKAWYLNDNWLSEDDFNEKVKELKKPKKDSTSDLSPRRAYDKIKKYTENFKTKLYSIPENLIDVVIQDNTWSYMLAYYITNGCNEISSLLDYPELILSVLTLPPEKQNLEKFINLLKINNVWDTYGKLYNKNTNWKPPSKLNVKVNTTTTKNKKDSTVEESHNIKNNLFYKLYHSI